MEDVARISREFLRGLRGKRSQVAFSRRLGYASNVAAEWESGRRTPYALGTLKACKRLGIDCSETLQKFSPRSPSLHRLSDAKLAEWLSSLRGQHTIQQLAHSTELSRYQVSRFLSGATRPRLHEFFALVSACTDRLSDLVFALVQPEDVPCLMEHHRLVLQSRRLAFEQPWTSAVVAALECTAHVPIRVAPSHVAHMLGLHVNLVESCIAQLLQVNVLQEQGGYYRISAALTIDTQSMPEGAKALRRHWAEVGRARIDAKQPEDLLAYNVFSVSREDYSRIRQLQLEYYGRVRTLIAQSKPEIVGLLNLQLLGWRPKPEKPD